MVGRRRHPGSTGPEASHPLPMREGLGLVSNTKEVGDSWMRKFPVNSSICWPSMTGGSGISELSECRLGFSCQTEKPEKFES